MKRPSFGRVFALGAGILAAAALFGCDKPGVFRIIPNKRPTVELTAAPASTADTAWYSYRLNWSGNDEDGRVDRYEYAIDPPTLPDSDTLWVTTVKNEQQVFFRATQAYRDPRRGWRSNDKHTFVIRAIDNAGAISAPKSRSFYSYTIAPVVSITSPTPSSLLYRQVTPAVRIQWTGRDEDGVFSQRPVQYKYKLINQADQEFGFLRAQRYPDSLRMFYAERNFAGWDSVSGDTTFIQYTQLTPGSSYMFVLIGFDEAGAYSPDFSLETNMLRFTPGFAGTLGPRFTVFSEFFFHVYGSGGYTIDPLAWINIEVPAGRAVTFNWFATPDPGSSMEFYRWKLDGDTGDESPRTNENTDWYHWSRKSVLTTTCTVGPFAGGEEHFLYIEGRDNNGLTSLAVVHMIVVQPTFAKPLLIVDDTRFVPDRFPSGPVPQAYGTNLWPAAAELDTFLFARGGFPWRGPHGVTGNLPLSKPGVFAGYAYDTLGTRLGFELASAGVPLSRLGQYRHVLWYTDIKGLVTSNGPENVVDPISTLRWITSPSRANTLGTYLFAGGEAWLAGGTAGANATVAYNASGNRDNDRKYGIGFNVFSYTAGELVPGRLMFDYAHWQSEFVLGYANARPFRSAAAVGGWTSEGWNRTRPVSAPDYTKMPASLRRRAESLGDSLPPTCVGLRSRYFNTTTPPFEYLTEDNRVEEDFDPGIDVNMRSTLDTLYVLQGAGLAASGRSPVTMTYYYGTLSPRIVFSGFDLWTWSRQDIVRLVDFVLDDIWGLRRATPAPAAARAAPPPGPNRPGAPGMEAGLIGGRSGSR